MRKQIATAGAVLALAAPTAAQAESSPEFQPASNSPDKASRSAEEKHTDFLLGSALGVVAFMGATGIGLGVARHYERRTSGPTSGPPTHIS